MSNLANSFHEQGKWQEDEDMHREVLELQRRDLGEDHPDTLLSRNNLALVLEAQGKWKEAEEMHKEVLEVRRRVLGEEHPDTMSSRNTLAIVLEQQGKGQEAEEMLKSVLAVRSQAPEEEHQDAFANARQLWEKAKQLHREAIGSVCHELEHPSQWNVVDLNNFGNDLAVPFLTNLWAASSFDQQYPWSPSPHGSPWSQHGWWPLSEASHVVPPEDQRHHSSFEPSKNAPSKPKKTPQAGKREETRQKLLPATVLDKVASPQSEMLKEESKKLSLSDVADNLCFLIRDAKELGDLDIVKESGFQTEVQNFLNDPNFSWTCLAVARKPCDQSNGSSDISAKDSQTLGVVAIKSSDSSLLPLSLDSSLKISCWIWLQKRDDKVAQRISAQVFVQIFGIRRNHLSLEGVKESTPIEAEIRCFFREGKKDKDEGGPEQVDLKDASGAEGLPLFAETFRSNRKLTGTSIEFKKYADIVAKQLAARANTRCNVPKPEIREKLLAGCTDSLCFLIRDAQELRNLVIVEKSGFQSEVQDFLEDHDPDFPWTCLAGVRMPAYQTSESYGIPADSQTLGVVAIKSSDGAVGPLKVSAGIWLHKKDVRVLRRIKAQIVLQVFGANPMHRNHDVRRNHHTLERVVETTLIEAVIRSFFREEKKAEKLQQRKKDEKEVGPKPLVINLKDALGGDNRDLLQKALESLNLKLEGEEQDFSKYADLVAKRLKARPEVDKRLKWKTIKDFKGRWLPGNLFKLTLSEHLSFDLDKKKESWKTLDGHIVVLLPSHDLRGFAAHKDEQLVARMDTEARTIYLVPRITLHPVGITQDQDSGKQPPDTDKLKQELTRHLNEKYQYKVLVRSGDSWEATEPRKARLCLGVVGSDTCMVQFEDGEHTEPQAVNAKDLRLARALPGINAYLGEGREAASLASSGKTGQTKPTLGTFTSVDPSDVLKEPENMKLSLSDFADDLCFLIRDAKELGDLDIVKESGFQSEVQNFLNDPAAFPWACCLAPESLGVVVIQSSDSTVTPLRISAGIWLRKREENRVLGRALAQIVLQVFGKRATYGNTDVRRNRFTLPGVHKATQMEAHLCCFFKNEKSQKAEKLQPENHIDLKNMRGEDCGLWLGAAFLSSNLKLTGEEQDFVGYADVVAKILRPGAPVTIKDIEDDDATSVGGASTTTATTATSWLTSGWGKWSDMIDSQDSEADEIASSGQGSQNLGDDDIDVADHPSSPVPSVGEASVTTATTASTATIATALDTGQAAKVKARLRCAHRPEIRNKLLPGCTDNICFLQGNATELSDLKIVEESGFQSEVQNFLPANDPDFPWTSLAGVSMPDYQTSESYGIPDSDSKILGVVAIKSSEAPSENSLVPLKISCGIWLKNEDPKVTRRIITQVVLQVFGKKPLFQNNDVRRNHHSLEGVKDLTPIEAEIRCFFRGTRDEGVPAKINLKDALGKEGLELLTETFKRSNMILTGTSVDFIDYSDIVATRLKKRPQNDLKIIKDKGCKRSWLPGNLFQFNLSEQLAEASKGLEWRTRLDGHIVVLLPWHDRNGSIGLGEAEEALVAPVDTKRRAIYLVPRITLHPVSADPEKLTKYLSDKYKYKVLVKSGKTWEDREPRKARLCLEVVGGDSCMVQFEGDGAKALPQPVNASDLRFARDMRRGGKLSEGQEAATLAPTAIESEA